jgi:hypothetical protein
VAQLNARQQEELLQALSGTRFINVKNRASNVEPLRAVVQQPRRINQGINEVPQQQTDPTSTNTASAGGAVNPDVSNIEKKKIWEGF